MYKCFENIPLGVRQRAFDWLLAGYQRWGGAAPTQSTLIVAKEADGKEYHHDCCPWGAVNYALLFENPEAEEGFSLCCVVARMPESGLDEVELLDVFGLTADPVSVDRFIKRNDGRGFRTFEQLARAMGVEYSPQKEAE